MPRRQAISIGPDADEYAGRRSCSPSTWGAVGMMVRFAGAVEHTGLAFESVCSALFFTVGQDTSQRCTARGMGHASSTIRRASFRRAQGVRPALEWVAWATGRPFAVLLVPRQLRPATAGLPRSTPQTDSSHRPNQHAQTSQLVTDIAAHRFVAHRGST